MIHTHAPRTEGSRFKAFLVPFNDVKKYPDLFALYFV